MLVEAVLQPQPEPGDLILQLPDGLAGVGGRDGNEERRTMNQGAAARWVPGLCPFPASTV